MAMLNIGVGDDRFRTASSIEEFIAKLDAGDALVTRKWTNTIGLVARGDDWYQKEQDLVQIGQVNAVLDQRKRVQESQAIEVQRATEQAQADTARYQQEAAAAAEARAALQRASEAKQLFRGNMAQLSANSLTENTPYVVGGATAQAQGNPDAQGANTGRPRQRRTAIASQLGIGV